MVSYLLEVLQLESHKIQKFYSVCHIGSSWKYNFGGIVILPRQLAFRMIDRSHDNFFLHSETSVEELEFRAAPVVLERRKEIPNPED